MFEFAGIFYQQDEPPPAGGSYPVVEDVIRTHFTSGSTTHNTVLPATIDAGDLILIVFGSDGNATVSATNFTLAYSATNGSAVRLSVLAKVAIGNEDGTTVNVATSASEVAGSLAYRITGWGGTIATDIVFGTEVLSSTSAHNPPDLTSGFGAVHTLWFAIAAMSGTPNISSYPTDYSFAPGTSGIAGGIGGTSAGLAISCWKQTIAASEDPPQITMAGSTVGLSNTMAIRGL